MLEEYPDVDRLILLSGDGDFDGVPQLTADSFKVTGRGENIPTVQSALYGSYYVRTVPSSDFGPSRA
jgi:hypothetical protein